MTVLTLYGRQATWPPTPSLGMVNIDGQRYAYTVAPADWEEIAEHVAAGGVRVDQRR